MNREDIKRRVQDATDIVQLIGDHVSLRARGREHIGLCPFHDDRSPSLNVSPAKQIYKCFACGAGGDVFSFVMAYHKMTFPEALKHLAERANVELPRYGGADESEGPSPRQRIVKANQHALDFYRRTLRHDDLGRLARDYIQQRGISDEMVEAFGLGAAPDEWDALAGAVAKNRWDPADFLAAGLIARRESSDGSYDRLRHRLIFPILDGLNRPLAFGGRVLEGSKREDSADAKYLNSPEHAAFNKSATLYGMHLAQKPIIDTRTAVIVEGYTDVIACHQAGVCNVVATLGTALTSQHAQLLRRYCDRIVLVFDGDEAGQKAADRALEVFFTEPIDVSIAILPDGLDPGDLLLARDDGKDIWERSIRSARDATAFQFERVRGRFDDADTMAGRQRVADEYLQSLVQLGVRKLDRKRYGLVFAQVAELLKMHPSAVNDQLRKLLARQSIRSSDPASEPIAPPHRGHTLAERHLVGAVLNLSDLLDEELPDGRPLGESIGASDFKDPAIQHLFVCTCEWLYDHETLGQADFRSAFRTEELLQLATDLQIEAHTLTDSKPDKLRELAVAQASAILTRRADEEYQRGKMENPDRTEKDDSEVEMRRIADMITRSGARSATRRVPRIVGAELKP